MQADEYYSRQQGFDGMMNACRSAMGNAVSRLESLNVRDGYFIAPSDRCGISVGGESGEPLLEFGRCDALSQPECIPMQWIGCEGFGY